MIKDLYRNTKDGAIIGYGVHRYMSLSAMLGWFLMLLHSRHATNTKKIIWCLIDIPLRCLLSVIGAAVGFCIGLLVCTIKIARYYSDLSIQNQLRVQLQRRSISPLDQQTFTPNMSIQLIEPLTNQAVSNNLTFSS